MDQKAYFLVGEQDLKLAIPVMDYDSAFEIGCWGPLIKKYICSYSYKIHLVCTTIRFS